MQFCHLLHPKVASLVRHCSFVLVVGRTLHAAVALHVHLGFRTNASLRLASQNFRAYVRKVTGSRACVCVVDNLQNAYDTRRV